MGRACTICTSEHRASIDAGIVTGESAPALAARFGVGPSAILRHAKRHVSAALAGLSDQEGQGSTLVEWVKRDQERTDSLYVAALAAGQAAQALNVLKERRGQHELLARLTGALDTRPQVTINLMASEEYIAVRSAILAALMAYPEAREEVAGRLLQLEAPK